jgi:hypothetical protein
MKTHIMNNTKLNLASLCWLTKGGLLFALLVAAGASAAEIVWTNTAGGNWNVAANWSPNRLPAADDTAVITNDGTYTVTLNTSPTIAGLILGGASGRQTFAMSANTLNLNGPGRVNAKGAWNFAGGNVGGTNVVTVEGTVNWSGGSIDPYASLTVATNGQLLISGTSIKTLNGSLTNAGTVVFGGSGDVRFNYSLAHNLPTGLFDLQGTGQLTLWSGSPTFVNEGTLRKSLLSGTTTFGLVMVNSGRLEVTLGTLAFGNGGTFKSGTVFAGTGNVSLTGGTASFQGDVVSDNLVWNGASVAGTATLAGTTLWSAGELATGAVLTLRTNSQLLLNGTGTKSLNGTLTNAGTITFSSGVWRFNASLLHNLAGAVLDIPWDGTLALWSGTPTLVNEGTVRKSAGTGTANCGVRVFNSGVLEVVSGSLTYASGSRFQDGTVFTGAGTNSLATGTLILAGHIQSDNAVLNGATLDGSGILAGSLKWLSGALANGSSLTLATNGQIQLLGTGIKTIGGGVTNAGLIAWIGSGELRFSAGGCHNLSTGVFDCQTNGTFLAWTGYPWLVNEGTFRKSAGTGVTTCPFSFVNRGVIEVNSGRASFSGSFTNDAGAISLGGGIFHLTRTLDLGGGVLTGFGTVSNAVINTGSVRPSSYGGVMQIVGDFTQTLAGEVEFWLAGTAPGVSHSQLRITGGAALAGSLTVRLAGGYLPAPGAGFTVLTSKNRAGDFMCRNGLFLLGENRRLETTYTVTNLTLVTINQPDPTIPPFQITADYPTALVCWPAEFTGWQLLANTGLTTTNWTILPGVTNRYLETPLVAEKYFRLSQP